MAQVSTSGISSGSIIEPAHVLRPINALNGTGSYDIVISGSLNVSGTMRIATGSITNVANQAVILAYQIEDVISAKTLRIPQTRHPIWLSDK